MALGILVLLSGALFAGFLALTAREARTGVRMLAKSRDAFDARVQVLTATFGHIDLSAFVFHFLRDAMKRVAHDIAHVTLAFVQALERLLRRLVVRMRARTPLHRGNPRAYVEYMTRGKRVQKPESPVQPADSEVE